MFEDTIKSISRNPGIRNETIKGGIYINTLKLFEAYVDQYTTITSPQDAVKVAKEKIGNLDRECFIVIHLNTKNMVIAVEVVSIGILNSSLVHPREVFKAAIINSSYSIILAHNHPSKNCSPSTEDKEITSRLIEVGKLIGIPVLDHLIIGSDDKYVSFKERGLI